MPDHRYMYDNRSQVSQVFQPDYPWSNRSATDHGEKDVYGIDVAPLSIFENHVNPVNVHTLSNSFRPLYDKVLRRFK